MVAKVPRQKLEDAVRALRTDPRMAILIEHLRVQSALATARALRDHQLVDYNRGSAVTYREIIALVTGEKGPEQDISA